MSVGVTCNESKVDLLDEQVTGSTFTGAEMMLSEVDITPDGDTVLADLTADEPTVSGYARQPLVWDPAALTVDTAEAAAAAVTFDNTDAVDTGVIYTWGYVNGAGTKLVQAGRFDTPFILSATSGTFTTIPRTRLSGE